MWESTTLKDNSADTEVNKDIKAIFLNDSAEIVVPPPPQEYAEKWHAWIKIIQCEMLQLLSRYEILLLLFLRHFFFILMFYYETNK